MSLRKQKQGGAISPWERASTSSTEPIYESGGHFITLRIRKNADGLTMRGALASMFRVCMWRLMSAMRSATYLRATDSQLLDVLLCGPLTVRVGACPHFFPLSGSAIWNVLRLQKEKICSNFKAH